MYILTYVFAKECKLPYKINTHTVKEYKARFDIFSIITHLLNKYMYLQNVQ